MKIKSPQGHIDFTCWRMTVIGRTSDRIFSATTRPEAGLIDTWCSGDNSLVAVNTAHLLAALQRSVSPSDAKCEAITLPSCQSDCCYKAIQNNTCTLSMHEIWLLSFTHWCLHHRSELSHLQRCLGAGRASILSACENQSMIKPIIVQLNFIWCENLIECTHQNGGQVWLANY